MGVYLNDTGSQLSYTPTGLPFQSASVMIAKGGRNVKPKFSKKPPFFKKKRADFKRRAFNRFFGHFSLSSFFAREGSR